LELVLLFIL